LNFFPLRKRGFLQIHQTWFMIGVDSMFETPESNKIKQTRERNARKEQGRNKLRKWIGHFRHVDRVYCQCHPLYIECIP
jgi:U3 small nucleolar RNA-associated protein 14